MRPTATMIRRPNRLTEKAPRLAGVSAAQLIKRADSLVRTEAAGFETWVQDDLAAMRAALKWLTAAPSGQGAQIAVLYKRAADVRDQGAVCGYPLVSEVADALCKFVGGCGRLQARERALVKTQLDALDSIIGQRLKDDASPVAKQLLRDMYAAIATLRKDPEPMTDRR